MLASQIILITAALVAYGAKAEPYDRDMVLEGAIGQVRDAAKLFQHYKSLGDALGHKSKKIEDEADIYEVVAEVRSKIEKWESLSLLSKIMNQKPPEEAIKLFASLPSGIVRCNFQGYLILASNFAAAIGNERYLKPSDQIKSSVIAAIESHRLVCGQDYFQRFTTRYEDIEPSSVDKLKQVFNLELLDVVFPKHLKDALRTTNLLQGFKSKWSSNLLKRLTVVVDGTEDARYMKSISSLASNQKSEFETKIVDKYLIKPCRSLVFELNDVFEPAKLDLALDDSYLLKMNPNHSVVLRDAWKRYLICNMINMNVSSVSRGLIERIR